MRMIMIGAALAAGLGAAVPAYAQDIELNIGRDGLRIDRECNPRYEDCRRYERRDDRPRGCSEGRALDKAERMGIRHARIDRVGRRTIEVRGRDRRGDRVFVTFGRERGCPIFS